MKPSPKPAKTDNVHYIGHRARLRERFIASKCGATQDYELLEILLFSAKLRGDVKPLAKSLIKGFGGFDRVFYASADELRAVDGVNDSAVAAIKAVYESIEKILHAGIEKKPVIGNWKKIVEYLRYSIGGASTENYRVLYLNKKNMLIANDLQDFGTVDQVPMYCREIIRRALFLKASALVLAHNHPSGDPQPSQADIEVTNQLDQACFSVSIKLIDHLILTKNDHFSFIQNNLL
ncbi:DNA repair protein RadC [Rickettsiales bacterium]|nr:DNA repair protein RadC [Rickettsiales bacterium]